MNSLGPILYFQMKSLLGEGVFNADGTLPLFLLDITFRLIMTYIGELWKCVYTSLLHTQ
jgi:hypothetical protein